MDLEKQIFNNEMIDTTFYCPSGSEWWFLHICPHESLSIGLGIHPMLKGNKRDIFWCTFCGIGINDYRLMEKWKK